MPANGSGGKVNVSNAAVADVRTWSMSQSHESKPYNSSDTAAKTRRLGGNVDWTASVSVYLPTDPSSGVAAIGAYVPVKLYVNATQYWSGNAWVDGIEWEVDVENNEIIGYELELSGDGEITLT